MQMLKSIQGFRGCEPTMTMLELAIECEMHVPSRSARHGGSVVKSSGRAMSWNAALYHAVGVFAFSGPQILQSRLSSPLSTQARAHYA